MGKQPQACVDRPPGAQAGGLLTEEGLAFGLWVQEVIGVGEGSYVTVTPRPLRK